MAKRGRPVKKPVAERIEDALGAAQQEIDEKMPKDLQVALIPEVLPPVVVKEPAPRLSKDVRDDYDFARANLHSLLLKGNEILEGISELCHDADQPRAYEVAGGVLKVLIDGTRELLQIQKDLTDIEKKTVDPNTPINIETAEQVNNVVVEASTVEMLEFFEKKRKQKEIE